MTPNRGAAGPSRIVLIGPPASGKGTVGPFLSELLEVPLVASGALLKESTAAGDPHRIAQQLERGDPVSDRIVADVVGPRLEGGFVLDGYPRTVRQANELDSRLAAVGQEVDVVIELVVPDEVVSARLSRGARLESRSDDNPDTIVARLVAHRREAVPLLAYYAGRVRRVNATRDLDDVCERAARAVSSVPRPG